MIPQKLLESCPSTSALAFLALTVLLLGGCDPRQPAVEEAMNEAPVAEANGTAEAAAPEEAPDPKHVMVWIHVGPPEYRNVIREQIHRFNTMQDEIQVDLRVVAPEESYDDAVQAAARAGHLPDLLEFDAPDLYKYIEQGRLLPLDDLLPDEIRDDLFPSVIQQGTYRGRLYSAAASEAGVGIYVNPLKLTNVNIRIPRSVRTAWTAEEFDQLLGELHEQNEGQPVLDLKQNYTDGWFSYAFSPALTSAGAGLLDPETLEQAEGTVNSEAAVRAMSLIQSWFQKGYIDPNEDDEAFIDQRVPLSWSGHWDHRRYDLALEGNFLIVPVPDFGNGSRTGHGGWSWGITREAEHPEAAAKFLEYMLQPEQILEMTEQMGSVPSRRSVLGRSSHYGEGMVLHPFTLPLENGFATRPQVPAAREINLAFDQAFEEIANGADVQITLDRLAETIDGILSEDDEADGTE